MGSITLNKRNYNLMTADWTRVKRNTSLNRFKEITLLRDKDNEIKSGD